MKKILIHIWVAILLIAGVSACNDDNGNYDYQTEEQVGIIEIDTTGIPNRTAFNQSYYPGDVINITPKIKYAHPENLKYSWIAYPYPYEAVQVGNATMYPKADTLSHELSLAWEVNLKPGNWTTHLIVEDTVRGLSASMKMQEQYFKILKPGNRNGVYVLSEYNGQTDIDFYTSSLCLIYGKDTVIPHYYSEVCKQGLLPGKPKFISWGQDYYYAFTENNGYRLNVSGLELMEDFEGMFYDAPTYNPQVMKYINNCEFLVNDGKLHVLYTNKTNDRKFSAPIGGNYKAATYLSDETRVSWGAISGAINSDQVIFDEKSVGFRPYFAQGTEISEFKTTASDAIINAKKLPAVPLAMQGAEGGKTYAVVVVNNIPYLYIMKFSNVIDDGDLSGNGGNSIINLSGCKDIMNMKYFVSNHNGSAFFYATDKAVYSFSPSSGQTTNSLLYECTGSETVTCTDIFYRHGGGGFPTAGVILWIGVWDEAGKEGKLVEFEIDPNNGTPRWMWGSSFSPDHQNPHITTGFGKIKSIAAK
ncbi:PKD-like family lipoprotein [Bacteroides reticulotermitis]|uniref:Uncharacterized protein n=2 Tax=Bacteroides reticulotermitis TaxID=1133319 RepID=W4UPC6_9BACE|nr:PKD-like family lipoprotein [Bacteroides reticulotermitis]MBB4042952.1 hypothetical protein [Bacteroides reticulotermitis]GAE83025.1 hypothetical protein JCM10512_1275 [Bacteroides reticulotermitis JCM 10512]